ncbi:MAG: hypothetical protein RL186_1083, partial [Pseudomonadota bacterium]
MSSKWRELTANVRVKRTLDP